MQPVFRNPFRARRALLETDLDPARLREPPSADRDVPPPARDTCGACPAPPPHRPPRADRTFRTAQTGGSIPFRPHIPPRTDRRFRSMQAAQFRPAQTGCSTRCRQAMLRTADRSHAQVRAQKNRDGSPLSTQRQAQKKTGRQPTLGPARGTGYRDASSCRRPAICGKISAQITRRTGTARQPGQPVVQI